MIKKALMIISLFSLAGCASQKHHVLPAKTECQNIQHQIMMLNHQHRHEHWHILHKKQQLRDEYAKQHCHRLLGEPAP